MQRSHPASTTLVFLLIFASAAANVQADTRLTEQTSPPARTLRPLTAEDLVRLRDIGPAWPETGHRLFSLSPDGRKLAFQLREADPTSNNYHLAMYVMDVRPGAAPIRVDEGGEIILREQPAIGGMMITTGIPATITPIWSADGKTILFLKRMEGKTQIWQAAADGSGSGVITSEADGVRDFGPTLDGDRIVYSTTRPDPAGISALHREELSGYRYDSRFIPLLASTPLGSTGRQEMIVAVDRRTGATLPTSRLDRKLLEESRPALPSALSLTGQRAWVTDAVGALPGMRTELHVDGLGSRDLRCHAPACLGATALWWTTDGARVRFIRRDGWGDSQTAIYEWIPGTPAPTKLYATDDLLIDCQPADEQLVCARETSASPRQLIMLDPVTGTAERLYDPNPVFQSLSLGRIERLHWRNRFGIETFGDLVYPVGYEPGHAYPLIVVQYVSRGFLRGGTGDEFPIQAFSNRGYAVLSVQRPSKTSLVPHPKSFMDFEARGLAGFKDRRSVLSAIEIQVRNLIRRGIVDPRHVGITGLSDGSSTVQFAAVNSRMFSAASVSACCWEPFQDAYVGPTVSQAYHQGGWPPLVSNDRTFWSHISIVQNARRVALPLLMQASDDEFRGALASYTALRQAGKPAVLYVFPNEYHVKWQPAHRLAAYERNLKWFDFWLRGVGDRAEWMDAGTGPGRTGQMEISKPPA